VRRALRPQAVDAGARMGSALQGLLRVTCPTCPYCSSPTLDGGPCGRDECPGEATRARATFGAPPPPRQAKAWKRTTGLRLERGGVSAIDPGAERPEETLVHVHIATAPDEALPGESRSRWARLRRHVRERWVSMWARIAQFMGVSLDG
jgi:hypothetical protein